MNTKQHILPLLLLAALPITGLASPDHWIYEADVELFDDLDSDGYYTFLSVRVDADSLRTSAWVFAELWLSDDGVNWEHYHSTDDFLIGGETGDDEIFIETELVEGYPTGEYDLLVELYDVTNPDFPTFSDEYGPNQDSAMALLPLEDISQDPEPVVVTVVDGGGGALSYWVLPALLLAGWQLRTGSNGRRQGGALRKRQSSVFS